MLGPQMNWNSRVALPSPSPRDALHVGRTFSKSFCPLAFAWTPVTWFILSATSSFPLNVLLKIKGMVLVPNAALTSSRLKHFYDTTVALCFQTGGLQWGRSLALFKKALLSFLSSNCKNSSGQSSRSTFDHFPEKKNLS